MRVFYRYHFVRIIGTRLGFGRVDLDCESFAWANRRGTAVKPNREDQGTIQTTPTAIDTPTDLQRDHSYQAE